MKRGSDRWRYLRNKRKLYHILLMAKILHQLRLAVYPIIYREGCLDHSSVSIPSNQPFYPKKPQPMQAETTSQARPSRTTIFVCFFFSASGTGLYDVVINLHPPKTPWTLQWKGLNLYSRGVLVLKIAIFEGSGSLGLGKLTF